MARTYHTARTLASHREHTSKRRPRGTDANVTLRHIADALEEAKRRIHETSELARRLQGERS